MKNGKMERLDGKHCRRVVLSEMVTYVIYFTVLKQFLIAGSPRLSCSIDDNSAPRHTSANIFNIERKSINSCNDISAKEHDLYFGGSRHT